MAAAKTVKVEPGKVKEVRHFIFDTAPLNLEELSGKAGVIFSGTCLDAQFIKKDPVSKLPVVKYTFKIEEGIRGVETGDTFTFKQWAATVRNDGYILGEEYVLFLHANSKGGLTSPVGFLQGKFKILREGAQLVVKNKLNNFGLVENPKTRARISLRNKELEKHLFERTTAGDSVLHEDFMKVIKELAKE